MQGPPSLQCRFCKHVHVSTRHGLWCQGCLRRNMLPGPAQWKVAVSERRKQESRTGTTSASARALMKKANKKDKK